jgi:RNA polymerase primary sigma factor
MRRKHGHSGFEKVRKVLKIAQGADFARDANRRGGGFAPRRLHRGQDDPVSPSEAVININLRETTEAVLKSLTPREERVIKMRFGRRRWQRTHARRGRPAASPSPASASARSRRRRCESCDTLRVPRKLKAFLEWTILMGRILTHSGFNF